MRTEKGAEDAVCLKEREGCDWNDFCRQENLLGAPFPQVMNDDLQAGCPEVQ